MPDSLPVTGISFAGTPGLLLAIGFSCRASLAVTESTWCYPASAQATTPDLHNLPAWRRHQRWASGRVQPSHGWEFRWDRRNSRRPASVPPSRCRAPAPVPPSGTPVVRAGGLPLPPCAWRMVRPASPRKSGRGSRRTQRRMRNAAKGANFACPALAKTCQPDTRMLSRKTRRRRKAISANHHSHAGPAVGPRQGARP